MVGRFLVGVFLLSGCFRPTQELPPNATLIGPSGGALSAGIIVRVPAGALERDVAIEAATLTPPAQLPGRPVSLAWRLGPSGLAFSKPVTVGLPLEAYTARVVAVTAPTEAGPFEELQTTVAGKFAWTHVSHFSIFIAVEESEADAGLADGGDAGSGGADADAGPPDAGEDAGPPFDAGSVCPPTPGWVDAGMPPLQFDAGECGGFFVEASFSEAWLTRPCLSGNQSLTCSYPDCFCSSSNTTVSSSFTFPQPVYPLTNAVMLALWQCECGFPALVPDVPKCTSTGDGGAAGPFSKAMGEPCSDGPECQYDTCMVYTSVGSFCSAICYTGGDCPCGFRCVSISAGGGDRVCVPY